MQKLWIGLSVIISLLLSGCTSSYFKLPVQENSEALKRFDKPIQYSYDAAHYPTSIENLKTGRTFEKQSFSKPPQRIVCVWQNSIETAIALGVGDRIVAGMGVFSPQYIKKEYRTQYENIPIKGIENLDQETILMLQPDMIIGWYSTFTSKYLRSTDFWHKRGTGTYIAVSSAWLPNGQVLENEFNDILNLGKVFDKSEKAEEIVNAMKKEINDVVNNTSKLKKRPRALILAGMGKQLGIYGENSLAGDLVKRLNGELLAADQKSISAEQIIEYDPDVIFYLIGETRYKDKDTIMQEVYARREFQHLTCTKNKRIVALPLNAIYTPGVRTMDGIKIIAHGLYPDLYPDPGFF